MFERAFSLSNLRPIIGDGPEADLALVKGAWKHVAGSMLAERTEVLGIESGKLSIGVENKTWERNLAAHTLEFVFKLNNSLGEKLIDSIVFLVREELHRDRAGDKGTSIRREESVIVESETAESISKIADTALRKQVMAAATAFAARIEHSNDGNTKDR